MKVRANPSKGVVTVELRPAEAMRLAKQLVAASIASAPSMDWAKEPAEPEQEEGQESY